jgi:hypothetical protein
MTKINAVVEFEVITCGECGIQFGVPPHWVETKRRDHSGFKCPNGHGRMYPGESDIEKAQRETREAQAQVNNERHLRLVAEKARDQAQIAKKKLEKRISHGVCACCNRTFENLARHMKSKHPEMVLPAGTQRQITGTVQ